MTASLQDRFVVGSPVESHEQMDAMPAGTVLEDGGDYWVKCDNNQWYDSDSDGTLDGGEGVDSSSYVIQGSFRIHSVPSTGLIDDRIAVNQPITSRDHLRSLPEGTILRRGERARDEFWIKDTERMVQCAQDGTSRSSSLRVTDFYYEGYYINSLPEAPISLLVAVRWQALTEGMYVRPISDGTTNPIDNLSILLLGSDSGTHTVPCAEDDGADITFRERDINAYASYQVLPQDSTYRALKAFGAAEAERRRLADTVVGREDVAATVRREVEAEWALKMEQLNRSAHEYADNNDLCSVFDDFMDEHSDLGFTPRKEEKDFEVELTLTGTIRKTVTIEVARGQDVDTDELYRMARDNAAFCEGDSYRIHSEDFTLTDIEDTDYEEV